MSDPGPSIFQDDDRGFLAWCRDHAGGFVIDAARGSFADPVLHRAECRRIQERTGERGGWTTDHVKVCADDTGDLTMWSYQHGAAPRDCITCDPRGGRARATPRKARTSTTPATREAIDAWLSRLEANDANEAMAGRRLIDWCDQQGLVAAFTRAAGSAAPETLVVSLPLSRGNVGLCSVGIEARSLFLDGDELKRTRPFTTSVGYAGLLERVLEIPGMRPTPRGRYPNVPTADLGGDDAWAGFTKTFEWIASEIRRSDKRRSASATSDLGAPS